MGGGITLPRPYSPPPYDVINAGFVETGSSAHQATLDTLPGELRDAYTQKQDQVPEIEPLEDCIATSPEDCLRDALEGVGTPAKWATEQKILDSKSDQPDRDGL